MKKIFNLFLIIALVFLCGSIAANAETYSTTDGFTYEISNGEATLVKCTPNHPYLYSESVPLTISVVYYNGTLYPVTEIGESAFSGSDLPAVRLTENVKRIAQNAFDDVDIVMLCDSVETISTQAFDTYVEKIVVDSSNPHFSSVDGVLYNKKKTVLIQYAGLYSSTNSEFTVPDGVTEIAPYAFSQRATFKKITLPESVSKIGECAFMGCTALTDINIPANVKRIEYRTFSSVPFSSLTIPESVSYIGEYAFSNSGNASADLVIPDSVTTLGNYAFEGCKFKAVTLSENIHSMGYCVFYNCSFTEVTIPGEITTLAEGTFEACTALTDVIIEEGVTTIEGDAFRNCSQLKNVTLPESLTELGSLAFYRCSALTDLTVPKNVSSIEWYTFSGCSSLKTITLPRALRKIEDDSFSGCTALTDVYFGGSRDEWSLVEIGENNECLTSANMHYQLLITYDDGISEPTTSLHYTGTTIIASAAPSRLGYEFIGWSDGSTTYQAGKEISGISADTSLYAVWERTIYTTTIPRYGNLQITPTGVPSGSSITLTAFNGKQLVFVKNIVYDGLGAFPVSVNCDYDTIKVFVWNSLAGLVPLCEPEIK